MKSENNQKELKKILVTGGAGYVGSVTVGMLLENGYEVRVFDNLRFGGHGLFPYLSNKNLEFMRGDIRNAKEVAEAVKGVDAVIHLAAIVGYPACRKEPEISRDINVHGTEVLINALPKDVPVIFASTGSTYGKMIEEVCTETTPLNPLSDYGRQKAEAEEVVKNHKEFVIFRFATAFGASPRMRLDLLPNDFTYRAVRDRTLIVYEKHFMRTFIHVRDMASAFMFAIQNYSKMKGEIYNTGDDSMNFSKEAICMMIKDKVDFFLHFADVGKDMDQRDYVVSYDKLKSAGFRTKITMDEGILELVKAAHLIEIHNPHYNA